jgi:hypothetical protein
MADLGTGKNELTAKPFAKEVRNGETTKNKIASHDL